jgi:hypothetical protein
LRRKAQFRLALRSTAAVASRVRGHSNRGM